MLESAIYGVKIICACHNHLQGLRHGGYYIFTQQQILLYKIRMERVLIGRL